MEDITDLIEEPEDWDEAIAELERYFESISLPPLPVILNKYTYIFDVKIFVENHIAVINTYKGERIGLGYLHRLQELKQHLINLNT